MHCIHETLVWNNNNAITPKEFRKRRSFTKSSYFPSSLSVGGRKNWLFFERKLSAVFIHWLFLFAIITVSSKLVIRIVTSFFHILHSWHPQFRISTMVFWIPEWDVLVFFYINLLFIYHIFPYKNIATVPRYLNHLCI